MSISRRGALLGASAAVAVAGVPMAVAAKAALAGDPDPVAALVNKALAYRDWLNSTPDDMPEEDFNSHCEALWEMYDQIRDTPAPSIKGILGKVRIAWIQEHNSIDDELAGPPDDFGVVGSLEPKRFVWSALQDLERLAGEARS